MAIRDQKGRRMGFEITPACDADYDAVGNLARLYISELAPCSGINNPADRPFLHSDPFANYWGRSGVGRMWPSAWRGFPFLIRDDGNAAGFALVKRVKVEPPTFDMGEFFVTREYRGRGLGRHAATGLFDRFAGLWEVREMPANGPAQAFWRRVIAEYTGGAFVETREQFAAYDSKEFIVQRFRTAGETWNWATV
jgi:predicted acetyltransferase